MTTEPRPKIKLPMLRCAGCGKKLRWVWKYQKETETLDAAWYPYLPSRCTGMVENGNGRRKACANQGETDPETGGATSVSVLFGEER